MSKTISRIIRVTLLSILLLSEFSAYAEYPLKSKSFNTFDGWRFGIGTGYSLYIGDQMDYQITRNYGDFKELRPHFTLSAFKQKNEEREWGFVYKVGSFQTLKSNNTQGIQCNYNEVQMVFNKSLNENVGLNGGPFTINFQSGLGLTYFKSMYYAVNNNFQTIDYLMSSVGYGNTETTNRVGASLNVYDDHIPNKKLAIIGNLGFNMGFRITREVRLYWENSLNISLSNKMSGNLVKTSKIPPDMYFYTGLQLSYRFGAGSSRVGCPRVWF
jgi:hypothetical protein